jgi:Predicted GTPase, probable translation factor
MQTGIIGLPTGRKDHAVSDFDKGERRGQGRSVDTRGRGEGAGAAAGGAGEAVQPQENYYATVQYVDLPGVQKERMRESLATLRDVDAIAHVIRVFDDPSVPHSEGSIDPLRDATNLDLELILSDHDQISKRLERVEKDLKKKRSRFWSTRKACWKSARRTWKRKNRCANWN